MKCSRCEREAVIELKYLKARLCANCFSKIYEKRFRRTVQKNRMFEKKDKIGVGVSGGKDSLTLLYLLKKRRYDLAAITIDEGIKGYRDKSMPFIEEFCEENNVPWHVFSFKKEYGFTLDEIVEKKKGKTCSYCGVLRRKLLNKAARELGCTKVATGHNLDDEAQMILMNFFRGDLERLARSGPIVGLIEDKKFVPRVKPLRECPEKEDVLYALIHEINYNDAECPYARQAYRSIIRETLNEIEEKHPGTKFSILSSFNRMLPFLKKYFELKEKPGECGECGELTAGKICKACQMLKEIRKS